MWSMFLGNKLFPFNLNFYCVLFQDFNHMETGVVVKNCLFSPYN
jgi:hypothetical protein